MPGSYSTLLARLRTKESGERVQLAILKLSEGSDEKLRQCVDGAKRDYRDVLLLAESSEEANLDTPEKRRKARELFQKLGFEPPASLLE